MPSRKTQLNAKKSFFPKRRHLKSFKTTKNDELEYEAYLKLEKEMGRVKLGALRKKQYLLRLFQDKYKLIRIMSLKVFVKNGQLLKSTDMLGKMENYVHIKCQYGGQSQEYRTKIVQGAAKSKKAENRIEWNQEVAINVPANARDARLFVRIMDEDMTSDDVAAEGWVNVANCGMFESRGNNYKLNMFKPAKKGKEPQPAGDLVFSTSYGY